jgi:hypothetical protein
MTTKISPRLQRKAQREEKKVIESILHPCPTVGDIEILHRHAGQYIEFEAWRGVYPLFFPMVGRRFIRVHRTDVLYSRSSCLSERDIAWLIGVIN